MHITLRLTRAALAIATAAFTSGGALAQQIRFADPYNPFEFQGVAEDDSIRLRASVGVLGMQGNEYVFSNDYTVSHLIWQTAAPVLRGSISVDVGHGFSVAADGSIAMMGTSYMEDYDWLGGDDTFANWTDRSQHPDTRLDHYWTGAASVGYDLAHVEDAVIRLQAGLKYTDVKWSAYGGSFVYTVNGFRDTIGNFPDGSPGISYRQQFPEVFVGVDGDQHYGSNIRVGGLLRGGITFYSIATDDHWMRDLHFVDSLHYAPTFTAEVDVGFKLSDFAEFILAARYDHIFMARGETRIYDIPTGALVSVHPDSGGGDLRSAELTAGLKARF